MSELGQKGLPRAIPAERLQAMLGANPAFCSWDALNSAVQKLTAARWPFLFSYPFMATNQKRSAP
jgi:hypothetical protein